MTESNPINSRPMSVKDWVLTLIILALPLVNLVMLLVWAFGSNGNINRKNYCLASLLVFAVVMGVTVVLTVLVTIVGAIAGSI